MDERLDQAAKRSARRLVWFLFTLLLFAVIDRSNVGFAALTMNRSLGLTAEMFGFGGAMFLTGYVLLDVPSNLLMARFGARVWLTRIALTWGVATALMAFAQGPLSFYALRFLIGAAEAGCLPGILYFLTQWFPRSHRGRYIAAVTLAIPVANALAPPVAALLVRLDGVFGLQGWRWLFLAEGAATFLLGVVGWLHLTDRPAEATWLPAGERDVLASTLAAEQAAQERVRRYSILSAMTEPAILVLALAYSGIIAQMNFSSLWLPQIYRARGAGVWNIAVLTALPFACAAVSVLLAGCRSDRTGRSFSYVAVAVLVAAAGWLLAALSGSLWGAALGFCVAASGVFTAMALFWSLPPRLVSGPSAAAAIALISAIGTLVTAVLMPLAGRFSTQLGWSHVLEWAAGLSLVTPASLWLVRGRFRVPAGDAAPATATAALGAPPLHRA